MPSKEELRSAFDPPSKSEISIVQGKLAERVRRVPGYRRSRKVFVEPTPLLHQTRVNALLDGKELIMPAAGLKEGFYLLEPFTIPFKDLSVGVTYKGLLDHGRKILPDEIGSLDISLLINESLVADGNGWRLGDGDGFFDLSVALLNEMGGLNDKCRLVSVLPDVEKLIEEVPNDPWDVRCDVVLVPGLMIETTSSAVISDIKWEALSMKRIKQITPLWKLYETRK